jgi:hypothetical protein
MTELQMPRFDPLETFLIGPGTEGMALEADVPWRLSERVGSNEATLDHCS